MTARKHPVDPHAPIPITAEERAEIIDMRVKGRSIKEIANWIGCTEHQVTRAWQASEPFRARQRERNPNLRPLPLEPFNQRDHYPERYPATVANFAVLETAREVAAATQTDPADPYKPGLLVWDIKAMVG